MRDPKRIPEILAAVEEAWLENPDLRLGQLIYNAARAHRPLPPCSGVFYMEDDELIGGLR